MLSRGWVWMEVLVRAGGAGRFFMVLLPTHAVGLPVLLKKNHFAYLFVFFLSM